MNEGSRGESIWDNYARKYPGFVYIFHMLVINILNNLQESIKQIFMFCISERNCRSNADETVDFYHRYKVGTNR